MEAGTNLSDLDRNRLIGALVLLVTALFVSGTLVGPRYRALARRAAIAGFLVALGVVLVWVAVWITSL
jgi:hypothetical protein